MFKRAVLSLAVTPLLISCGSAPPNIGTAKSKPSERFAVPVAKVVIVNYMAIQDSYGTEVLSSGSYSQIPDNSTVPRFSELVFQGIDEQLIEVGGERTGPLEIALLKANLLVEKNSASGIPFIGLAAALSERSYLCRVDANFRYADKSERKTFEVMLERRNRLWGDLSTAEKAATVEKCLGQIVREVADFSSKLVNR